MRDVSFDVGCGEVVALLGQNGAFLDSTTIRPGRVNVWGTVVGVGTLAIGIAGYSQRRRRAAPAKPSKPGSAAT